MSDDSPPPNPITDEIVVAMMPLVDAMKGFSEVVASVRADLEASGFSPTAAEAMVIPIYHGLIQTTFASIPRSKK